MNVGQCVLLIGTWEETDCVVPPIGAVGEIISPMDAEGDYEVTFPGYPCHWFDPDWFTPHWAIIPIDDGEPVKREAEVAYV